MFKKFTTVLLACFLGLLVGGCHDWDELKYYFVTGAPEDVSSCDYVMNDEALGAIFELNAGQTLSDLPYALCAECNSAGSATAKDSYCGSELSVRCSSNLTGPDPLYGIAIGFAGEGDGLSGSAWVDDDNNGADTDDPLACHSQAVGPFGKSEWKCTNALKGPGKDTTTFEASVKYDDAKNFCP